MSVINKLGRRKASVARVYLKEGKGKITIKDASIIFYDSQQNKLKAGATYNNFVIPCKINNFSFTNSSNFTHTCIP